MPTIAQLRLEPWWDREIITPELDWLGDELCRRTGAPAYSIGTKGDENHLSGGHRSQEWIVNSDWCTNTSYTVQAGLTAEQARHIAALDRTPGSWGTAANRARMALETGRLVAAGKAGKLVGVRQIQGTLDGKTTYGINLPSLNTSVPSSSHLDHWHLTFDRRYLRDAALMARIADVVTGGPGEDEDMTPEESRQLQNTYESMWKGGSSLGAPVAEEYRVSPPDGYGNSLADQLAEVRGEMAKLKALVTTGGVDPAAVAAALAPLLPTADAIAAAVGKREAAADRARADELD